jgi:hypothetical protein
VDAGQAKRFGSVVLGFIALSFVVRAWMRWEIRQDRVSVGIGAALAVACVVAAVASWQPKRW